MERHFYENQIVDQEASVQLLKDSITKRKELLRERQGFISRFLYGDKPIMKDKELHRLNCALERSMVRLENRIWEQIQFETGSTIPLTRITNTDDESVQRYRDRLAKVIRDKDDN